MIEELEDTATWEAEPATPGRARALVEQVLCRVGQAELAPTATLLTSEIVTNAVVHVGGPVAVRVKCRPALLRVEVADTSELPPVPAEAITTSTGGRGLHLVEALATRWGTTRDDAGKIVWFELAVDAGPPASTD